MNKPLRIALFTDSLHPSGVGCVMTTLARCLPAAQYKTFLICADHEGADELACAMRPYVSDTFRCTVRWDDDVAALPALVSQLQAWNINIFHNHIGATWEGDWGTIAARCAHVPLVVATDHIPCVLRLDHELHRRRRVNQLLDRQFAVSEGVRQSLLDCDLIEAERAFTVENGVEAVTPRLSRPAARLALNLPPDMPIALFAGRLVEQKDPYVLLDAIAQLRAGGQDTFAIFAGDGWARHACEGEARRLGVAENVRFLGNCESIVDLLTAADTLAMPSKFEGMPLAALEAMSVGLPIVGCDAPGVRDVVTHDLNGWLTPVADPAAFADGLARAFTPDTGMRWGNAGRALYEQRFTAAHLAARQDQAYQEALAAQSPKQDRVDASNVSRPRGRLA